SGSFVEPDGQARRVSGLGGRSQETGDRLPGARERLAADGGVQDLDRVHHRYGPAHPLETCADLQQAARVAAHEHGGAGGENVLRLALAELRGRFGLDQVVDARGTAADLGFRDLPEL